MIRIFRIVILFLAFLPGCAQAGIDPARAAAIDLASELEKKALDTQYKVQMLQATGHIWTRQEVDAVTDFQKEFNDYISTFNNLLTYAAEIYGIYYDVNSLAGTLSWLNREIGNHPENAFAVALSTRKNNIYMKVLNTGIDVAMDIRQIVMDTKGKATEAQRMEALGNIRPKLRKLEKEIRILCKYIRYTSMNDLWREITGRHYTPTSRKDVAIRCHQDWMASAKNAKNTKHK